MPTHDISHRLAGNFQIVDLDHHPSRRLKHNSENPLIQNDEVNGIKYPNVASVFVNYA